MKRLDHDTYREWLHLECDGELPAADRSHLRQHLDSCADCRAESQELVALDKLLTESRIPIHRRFHDDVMSALPNAGWESSHPRSWVAALIVAALLGITGAALLGTSAARLEPAAPFVAAIVAVVDLFQSTALAGAGLLTASWKGLGLAFQELLAGSVWNLLAVGLLVFGLDFLLIRLLLRRNRPTEAASRRNPPS
jgi:anti-sigma factor RsiW